MKRGTVWGTHVNVRFSKEAFVTSASREKFFLTWVKVENVIVTFSEQEDEDTLVDVGPQIERGTVFRRDTCRSRNFRDKRFPREACFGLGDVKVEMKRRMKTFSWRKDLKLNASRCFSGTHATV